MEAHEKPLPKQTDNRTQKNTSNQLFVPQGLWDPAIRLTADLDTIIDEKKPVMMCGDTGTGKTLFLNIVAFRIITCGTFIKCGISITKSNGNSSFQFFRMFISPFPC